MESERTDMKDWDNYRVHEKLAILAGETLIPIELLRENEFLMYRIKQGASYKTCVDYVNTNF